MVSDNPKYEGTFDGPYDGTYDETYDGTYDGTYEGTCDETYWWSDSLYTVAFLNHFFYYYCKL